MQSHPCSLICQAESIDLAVTVCVLSVLHVQCVLQGFGVAAKSTEGCRHSDPMVPVVFHQADIGEYVRNEDALT